MTSALRLLAAPRLTLGGMAVLGAAVVTTYVKPVAPEWLLPASLALLAINLACALLAYERLRRGGLLVFHLALLGLVVLAGIGRLARFEGRVEVAEGSAFSAADAVTRQRGILHPFRLDRVHFVQGPFTVNYVAGLNRAGTRSRVWVRSADGGWTSEEIGDDKPLLVDGYRFYTTSNKGFAPLLTWTPDGGRPISGTVDMPSYPLYDWNQENRWTPPGGAEVTLKLHIETDYSRSSDWVLDGKSDQTVLTVVSGGRRFDLKPGQTARLPGGSLRFDALRTWMGYSIFYDPTLVWLVYIAGVAVCGLAWHYWPKSARRRSAAGAILPIAGNPIARNVTP